MAAAPDPTASVDPQLAATRVFLRPIASPFGLGFIGLAGASVTLSALELGYVAQAERHQAAIVALLFAPLLQTIACVFGFLGRDAVGATGMGTLAGTWGVIGLVELTTPPGSTSDALAVLLFLATAAVGISAATAAISKLVPAVVLLVAALRFCLTGVYELTGLGGWHQASGYTGLVLAFVALYGAASLELEGVRKRPLLPTLRHGEGARALDRDLAEQVSRVATEAGVRKQL